METLGAGVIGLRMGASHAGVYADMPGVELRAVCDVVEETARSIAKKHSCDAVTDYRDLVARDDIHVISVASPDHLHAEHCIAALQAGKHVLCEKPLALTMEHCRAIVEAVDRSGLKFMVGQVCRYTPAFVLTKRLIEDGVIGSLFFVESEYAHAYDHILGVGGWRKDPKVNRHPLIGGGCHAVDLVRWVAGDVEEAFAYSNKRVLTDWPQDDCTIATFRFESGALGKVLCSIGCRRPYTMRSVFYGDKGTIISDNTSPAIQVYTTAYAELGGFASLPVGEASHNVRAEIAELVEAIRNDLPVKTDVREGARTVATCVAAIEAAAIGRPAKVEAV
jgi:predicted dehydrogenase